MHPVSLLSYPFAMGASMVRGIVNKQNQANLRTLDKMQSLCFSGTRRGKCEAYQEIIRPCQIAYSKICTALNPNSEIDGVFLVCNETNSYDPGFEEVTPLFPE